MNTTEKVPYTKIRNIRFKDAAQVALIKRAAEHHDLSFNAFVVRIMQEAAVLALDLPPAVMFDRIIVLKPHSSSRKKRSK
jgi:uncharacterized protein (DUF1778 family)